jgi:hypothetical protein
VTVPDEGSEREVSVLHLKIGVGIVARYGRQHLGSHRQADA